MQLRCEPVVGPPLGAIVRGWEPAEPLSHDDIRWLKAQLAEHLVLLFREHRAPTDDELIGFASSFGPLAPGGTMFGVASTAEEIVPVTNRHGRDGKEIGVAGGGPLPWHTDYSFTAYPAKISFLDAVEVPRSRTHFCDMYHAWETLDPAVREELGDVTATHHTSAATQFLSSDEMRELAAIARYTHRDADLLAGAAPERHPIAMAHPETGRVALYVSSFVQQVEGCSIEESDALLERLHRHAMDGGRIYTHEWRVGDLVMFDAVGTMHRRDGFDYAEPRTMRQLSALF